MAVQNDNTILKKADLKAYHERIAPMLGGTFMVSTNVSDYYSTDEKVAGVWTDGKPVYQKTYLFNSPSTPGTKADVVSSIPENLEKLIEFNGTISAVNYSYNINDWRSDTDYNTCWLRPSTIAMVVSNNLINSLCILTIKYTKTTDAAGSGVTTPGAYDVNFPNTWPVNTEIYFGNGVYGYRATGNVVPASGGGAAANNVATIANFTGFINYGGRIDRGAGRNIHSFPYVNPNGANTPISIVSWGSGIYAGHDDGKVYLMFGQNYLATDAYDVWFTYTK